jgi:hypothetical protein
VKNGQLTGPQFAKGENALVDPRTLYFTKNFTAKAKSWKLTEDDAKDVYFHGDKIKENIMVRNYNGYEIGIYYFKDPKNNRTFITSIWRQDQV